MGAKAVGQLQFDENQISSGQTDASADYDKDALSNVLEYAFGLDPQSGNMLVDGETALPKVTDSSSGLYTVEYIRSAFAYELDYEKYMEDQEIRQALAIIKDRVREIKQDDDWKQKFAREWNEANEVENQQDAQGKVDRDQRSEVSYHSVKTGMSKQSLRQ